MTDKLEELRKALVSALRFAASRSAITADEERAIIAAFDGTRPTTPSPIADELDRPSEAIEVLAGPYRQLDEEGVIVGVSRQAVHETLEYLQALEAATLVRTQSDGESVLRERWAMIDQLRGAEGCSVEIIHDNPDPGASNCAIYVTDNFGEDYSTYYGDTIDDCLRQAVSARQALGGNHG